MKFMLPLLALGYVALASPSPSLPVNPGGIGGLFKGPNSETIIKGPDGSVITAAAEGGAVQTNPQPVVLSEQTVVQEIAPIAIATPAIAPIEAVAVPAPVVESKQSSELIGPSGRISTHGSQSVVAGPASTTVTGPAVVAETVVKGPPIVASPIPSTVIPIAAQVGTVAASSIAAITGAVTATPVSVTATPLVSLAPIAVTASPLTAVTPPELIALSVPAGVASIQVSDAALNIPAATVAANSQTVAAASASPHLSVASASTSSDGRAAIASATPNVATASVNTNGNVVTSVTASPLPIVSSTIAPTIVTNGVQKVDLRRPQLLRDQIAVDNQQLRINPALIPANNIIPPEIGVINRERLASRPTDILTTPGLSTVGTSSNVQREEANAKLNVLQTGINTQLTPEQAVALQNQQILLNNQIQHAQQAANARILQAADPRLVKANSQVVSITPRNEVLLSSTANPRLVANGNQVTTLLNVQQQRLLSDELARSGIDASQLQLTNVPLSAVSALPVELRNPVTLKGGLPAEAWGRYERQTDNKKN